MRNSPPPSTIKSRTEIPLMCLRATSHSLRSAGSGKLVSVKNGSSARTMNEIASRRTIRVPIAASKPIRRASFCCSAGSRLLITEMKTMLSIPRMISIAVKATRAITSWIVRSIIGLGAAVADRAIAERGLFRLHLLNEIRIFHKRGRQSARFKQANHEFDVFLGEIPRELQPTADLRLYDRCSDELVVEHDAQFPVEIVAAQRPHLRGPDGAQFGFEARSH